MRSLRAPVGRPLELDLTLAADGPRREMQVTPLPGLVELIGQRVEGHTARLQLRGLRVGRASLQLRIVDTLTLLGGSAVVQL